MLKKGSWGSMQRSRDSERDFEVETSRERDLLRWSWRSRSAKLDAGGGAWRRRRAVRGKEV